MAGRRRWRIRARPGVHRVRAFMGVPFLHPWANRTRGYKYRTGGHDVTLDRASQLPLLDDHGLPIHGVLTASSRASVCASVAGDERARLIASLDFDTPELSGGHRQRIVLAPRALLLRKAKQHAGRGERVARVRRPPDRRADAAVLAARRDRPFSS